VSESAFIKHEPCEHCGSSDAKGTYSDGHTYCFSCKHVTSPNRIQQARERFDGNTVSEVQMRAMPADQYENPIGAEPLGWLYSYGLTSSEIQENSIRWSPARRWLTFAYYGQGHVLYGWQARTFPLTNHGESQVPRWLSFGKMHEIFAGWGLTTDVFRPIVVVEDVISAIKVGRQYGCRCIFGSSFTPLQAAYMKSHTRHLIFWLDRDKAKEALKFAEMSRGLGLRASTLITDLDPKKYTDTQIYEFVNPLQEGLEPTKGIRIVTKT